MGTNRSSSDEESWARIRAELDGAVELLRSQDAVEIARLRKLAVLGREALSMSRRNGLLGRETDMQLRAVAAEFAAIARCGDRRVQNEIGRALEVVDGNPLVLAAWEAGRLTAKHVDDVVKLGRNIPDENHDEWQEAAIAVAERDVPARVHGALESLAQHFTARTFAERHKAAVADRGVFLRDLGDGMSELTLRGATTLLVAIDDRLNQMAVSTIDAAREAAAEARAAGEEHEPDTRTRQQVRADVLCDLGLTGGPAIDPTHGVDGKTSLGAIRARVQVVVTADTLSGKDDRAAELVGAGLIDADTARTLAGDATLWDRVYLDATTKTVTRVDQYRPPAALRRMLQARDRHCRWPGCHLPAIRCELDHSIDHALGGPTCESNLCNLCQRHHSMKQFTDWLVLQLGGGIIQWTSPSGRVYREDLSVPSVCFTPEFVAERPPPEPAPPF
ncbi:HNH endonuclease [Microbacterium radiodurans]|nr:HNH endonuclease signature motif containing protein [Microbacterium radiodurans]